MTPIRLNFSLLMQHHVLVEKTPMVVTLHLAMVAQLLTVDSNLLVHIVPDKLEGVVVHRHPLLQWDFVKLTDVFDQLNSSGNSHGSNEHTLVMKSVVTVLNNAL